MFRYWSPRIAVMCSIPLRFLILCILSAALCEAAKRTLYFASSGWQNGQGRRFKGGLYAGFIEGMIDGVAKNLTQIRIECPIRPAQDDDYVRVTNSLSYDPIKNKISWMMHKKSLSTLRSLFEVDICMNAIPCESRPAEALYERPSFMKYLDFYEEDVQNDTYIFALYNGEHYFISSVRVGVDRNTFELRRMKGCTAKELSEKDLISECSEKLAVIGKEGNWTAWDTALGRLLPVDSGMDNKPVFLVQILDNTANFTHTNDLYFLNLFRVQEGEATVTLYSQKVPKDSFLETYKATQYGDIDYNDGTVCWSLLDTIKCASWDKGNSLDNVFTALYPNKAVEAGICKGDEYANLTSGVTILNTQGQNLELLFGCKANHFNQGGGGYLKMTRTDSVDEIQLFQLRDDDGPVNVGQMILMGKCTKYTTELSQVPGQNATAKDSAMSWRGVGHTVMVFESLLIWFTMKI